MSDAIENMISAVEHGANKRGGGMMVKRYDPELTESTAMYHAVMAQEERGDYVLFTDYESLERERDAMAEYLKSRAAGNRTSGDSFSHYENFLRLTPELAKGADHER